MNVEQIKELACGVNPEFISVNDWEEIITSLARRVIAAEKLVGALEDRMPEIEDHAYESAVVLPPLITAYREASK